MTQHYRLLFYISRLFLALPATTKSAEEPEKVDVPLLDQEEAGKPDDAVAVIHKMWTEERSTLPAEKLGLTKVASTQIL